MSRHRLTVVLSQAPGKHPAKRALEESVAAALILEPGLDVSIVPHLYDLDAQHTGRLFLESVGGDMVVLSWLYPRAAFWLLDRDGVKGRFGETKLKPPAEEEEEDGEPGASATGENGQPKGIGSVSPPDRFIYCLDLRDFNTHTPYVEEVRRIAAECRERHAAKQAAQAVQQPPVMVQLGLPAANGNGQPPVADVPGWPAFAPEQLLTLPNRRWYPVIDYSRCTNCLECLDFCLFGVYGVDALDRIFTESQDSCKKGCPACSRVCPENAIMFPDFKTPAIAGADGGAVGGLKIDLTKLFGGGDPLATAVSERDAELVKDGRAAVGMAVGIPKRQADKPQGPKDDLDKLMDDLDALLYEGGDQVPRILAIGDIHGCSRALDVLLADIAPQDGDTVVILGDAIDRGPDSKGVLDRLLDLHHAGRLVALRGNHELMLLAARHSRSELSYWLYFGGTATLAYGAAAILDDIPARHWEVFESVCVDWHECSTHFFVHANAYPDCPLEAQPETELFWQPFCDRGPHFSGKVMVCGHTQQRSGRPLNVGHTICLDTWAYGGGWLTGLDVTTGRVWQANQPGERRTAHIDDFLIDRGGEP